MPVMRRIQPLLILLPVLIVCGCLKRDDGSKADVAFIGDRSTLISAATAEGLVAFDGDGQIEPGLAERWAVTEDGLAIVFRLAPIKAHDGHIVSAQEVARSLKQDIASAGKGRIGDLFTGIIDVVAMTDRVIEIRLKAPRPAMLELLAQPEMGVRHNGAGLGPLKLSGNTPSTTSLTPIPVDDSDDTSSDDSASALRQIKVRSVSASLAVTRFKNGTSQVVLGGTIADYPLVRAANIPASQVVTDPAQGFLGFVATAEGSLGTDADMRHALDMAIDRPALVRALALPGWQSRTSLLPARYDMDSDPAQPDWVALSVPDRLAQARQAVAAWRARQGKTATIRIAMPGSGLWRVLFARLTADWAALGVRTQWVGPRQPADLVVIDEVSPDNSVNWYFTRLSCEAHAPCDSDSRGALDFARAATTVGARASAYTQADQIYTLNAPAIILGNPFRWSLAKPRMTGIGPNLFAEHSLAHLR